MNVDAAWNSCPTSTGFGAVCRDSSGMIKGASASFVDLDFSPTIAELRVVAEGLNLALVVESNCLRAINLILKKSESWSEEGVLVEAI